MADSHTTHNIAQLLPNGTISPLASVVALLHSALALSHIRALTHTLTLASSLGENVASYARQFGHT